MDPILNIRMNAPQVSLPAHSSSDSTVPALPKPTSSPILPQPNTEATFDPAQMEKRRYEAVKQAAQDTYILGDQRFTIFKDSTGQYITRFTSLRDGRVTYIPEPQLLGRNKGSAPVLILNA